MSWTAHSSRACTWNNPRPSANPARRLHIHGPIRPMVEPRSFLARLFGIRR